MSSIKVSIAVAIYNSEDYLRQCVDSLLMQTLDEIEILLISDRSPDNSMAIMEEYHLKYPHKIKIFETPENLRAGGARNLGLIMSSGEYFAYVDADDYVDRTMYEKLYAAAKKEVADCASCLVTTFDDEIGERKARNYGGGFCNIIRRQLLIDNNIKFPEKKMYEDNYFWPLVKTYINKEIIVNENLYFAREQRLSVRHTITRRTIEDRLDVEEMLIHDLRERNIKISNEMCVGIVTRYCLGTYYLFALSKVIDRRLIRDYVSRSNQFLLNIKQKYWNSSQGIYKSFSMYNRIIVLSLQKYPKIAYCLTMFSASFLRHVRNVKRFIQNAMGGR